VNGENEQSLISSIRSSVSITSGVAYDSQYSREPGHEGEYLGTATRTLDTTKGVGYGDLSKLPGTAAGGGYSVKWTDSRDEKYWWS
jgi:hypothetical protein